MIRNAVIALVLLLAAFFVYVKISLSKVDFQAKVRQYKPVRINVTEGGVINIILDLLVFNPLFFSIPIESLYYEIWYQNHILGKSADTKGFTLKYEQNTPITQSVDLHIDKKTITVAKNYLLGTPTDLTAKVYVRILGIGVNLKNIKFTV